MPYKIQRRETAGAIINYDYMRRSNGGLWNVDRVVNGTVYLWTRNSWGKYFFAKQTLEEFKKNYVEL